MKTPQWPLPSKWISKLAYSYSVILFSHKKECSPDTCYMMNSENIISERSQLQKTTYCVITFV